MPVYDNLSGDSDVYSFDLGKDFIIVRFTTNESFLYTYLTSGAQHIENMKSFALQGQGLSSYIKRFVGERSALKL